MSIEDSKESLFPLNNAQSEVKEHISEVMTAELNDASHFMDFYNDLRDFALAFKNHVGEKIANQYYLYHTIIGSTPGEQVTHFDGDDEWSIEKKVEELLQKYPIAES